MLDESRENMAKEMLDSILEDLYRTKKTILLTHGMTPDEIELYIESKSKECSARYETFTMDDLVKDLLKGLEEMSK